MNSQVAPPFPSDNSSFNSAHRSTDNSFPIIAIAVIGILATAFLLISYYVFVIKCCLNWHRVDILRRFSTSYTRHNHPHVPHFPSVQTQTRGLDESTIRKIPILSYKNCGYNHRSFRECTVCLSEFQDEDKLRFIPSCKHMFHIDCIDVWLQSNENCPVCRTNICATTPIHSISQTQQPLSPLFGTPTLYSGNLMGDDEDDFIVFELPGRHSISMDHSLLNPQTERSIPYSNSTSSSKQPFARLAALNPEQRVGFKAHRANSASKGDECIDIRANDSNFDVQPIRRSFSMGSSDDHQLYSMVQEIIKQQQQSNVATEIIISPTTSTEGCINSSKLRRSFFSFGSGRGSKSSILPVHSNS